MMGRTGKRWVTSQKTSIRLLKVNLVLGYWSNLVERWWHFRLGWLEWDDEKGPVSKCILKVKLIEFFDSLGKRVKDNSSVFAWATGRMKFRDIESYEWSQFAWAKEVSGFGPGKFRCLLHSTWRCWAGDWRNQEPRERWELLVSLWELLAWRHQTAWDLKGMGWAWA